MFKGINLTLNSDVDQDANMFGLHENPRLIDTSSPGTHKIKI